MTRPTRRGFTLIELLITAVVMAILGTILARMLVQDSRFVDRVESMMTARQSARAAMHVMSTELSMVTQAGIVAATPKRLGVYTPLAWGMACRRNGSRVIASLLPTDSMVFAASPISGIAWQDSTGKFKSKLGSAVIVSSPRTECTADSIRTLAGGENVEITSPTLLASEMLSGTIFYVYNFIVYEFKASGQFPGRIGLFRTDEANSLVEEILAPFDTSSGFAFLTNPNGTPSRTPPAVLDSITAVELILVGESIETPRGATDPEEFELRTRVAMPNR